MIYPSSTKEEGQKMQYTQGKWEQDGNSIQVHSRGCICSAPKPTDGGVMERMDNLLLIAAAPGMYSALKEITELAPRNKLSLPYAIQVVEIAEKALAKAEGKKED